MQKPVDFPAGVCLFPGSRSLSIYFKYHFSKDLFLLHTRPAEASSSFLRLKTLTARAQSRKENQGK